MLSKTERRVIALSSLGGCLEFYDFVIYVYFAGVISHQFFPATDKLAELMGVFAVFSIGYLVRPLGGILFSHFGDRFGRKKMFVITVFLMAVPTFLIGCVPSYQQIGILAPILLTLLRVLQGFSVGGEIPGATVFTAEHANAKNRGLACALIFFGINIGLALGALVTSGLSAIFSPAELAQWGWRIAFFIGGFLGIVSYHLRKHLTETPLFSEMQQTATHHLPLVVALKSYTKSIFIGIGLNWGGGVFVIACFPFLITYLSTTYHYSLTAVSLIGTACMVFFASSIVLMGWMGDRVGRRKMLMFGFFLLMVLAYPLYTLFALNSLMCVFWGWLGLAFIGGIIFGNFPCAMTELFPTAIRYTGFAFSYNFSAALFGGLTPLISTQLIRLTHQPLAPCYYLIASAAIGLLVSAGIVNLRGQKLS